MRKIFLAALILSFGIASCNNNGGHIRLATGGSTGTYYTFGHEIGKILSEKTNIPISVQASGASIANIILIDAREAELAIVQNDVMDSAWQGVELFDGKKITSFSCMAALYSEVFQVVVTTDSGIRTIADLRDKNISVGDMGSAVEYNARHILETYGITFEQVSKQNLSFGASADALRDNRIDAFFCIAGYPTPAIVNLAEIKEIVIL